MIIDFYCEKNNTKPISTETLRKFAKDIEPLEDWLWFAAIKKLAENDDFNERVILALDNAHGEEMFKRLKKFRGDGEDDMTAEMMENYNKGVFAKDLEKALTDLGVK